MTNFQHVELLGRATHAFGCDVMSIPDPTDPIQRRFELHIPNLPLSAAVTATLSSEQSFGDPFVIYKMIVQSLPGVSGVTQIVIAAQYFGFGPAPSTDVWCNYVSMAFPLPIQGS